MTDLGKHKEYELNEKDIDSVLNFLRIFDPSNATPEKAIGFLVYLRIGFHEIGHDNPEKLEQLFKKYINQGKEKSRKL